MSAFEARLDAGPFTRRALQARCEPGGLRITLDGLDLGGAWVTVTLHEIPGASGNARLRMSFPVTEGQGTPLVDAPLGRGSISWTGRLPKAVREVRIASSAEGASQGLRRAVIRRRGRPALLALALTRAPALTAQAVYWRVLGLRVRGRGMLERALRHRPWGILGRMLGLGADDAYADWIKRSATLGKADRERVSAEISGWNAPPLISVLMPVHDPEPRVLRAAIRSVQAQIYRHWELCIVDDASTDPRIPALLTQFAASDPRIRVLRRPENGHIARATNDALALATGTYCAFLDHDDALPEQALHAVARTIRSDPGLVLIYADEDKIDRRGRRFEPHFKPGFDRELLYAQNYINHPTVVRTEALRAVGGLRPGFEGSQDHDLLLRLTRDLDPARIRHIPEVLYHWRAAGGSGTFSDRALVRTEAARLRALEEIVAPSGGRAKRGTLGFNRVVWPLPEPAPRVSVVIPTRDRADLLRVTLDGLLARTDYPDIEVIVLDNDSREPETRALFASLSDEPRLRVIPVPGPFNFSDLSNRGAAAATGAVLLFLNNDVEIVEPGWLRELASIALRPEIGAVGAKLLYPDGTVQHGGVILGIGGVAGHSHLGLDRDDPGYFARMTVAHETSAVTGACLAMRASVFAEVGGFDAEHLKVAFNDIDLCLRVRAARYRIVWTPFATLIHHESKSRGPEDTPEKLARFDRETEVMLARWEPVLRADPYYNVNLSRASGHYRL